ncbi:hypothetical protein AB0K34_11075 [Actinomadura sp. NPDC049382]|uniref:hypothetical protein n=1 Tax=Actinomadura sp. NPDC049382 TaxID=3158220 RepID=UPI003446564A
MTGDDIYSALSELRDRIPRLNVALAGGTPRRWTQRDLTPDERRRRSYQDREDRRAKDANARLGFYGVGDSRAPINLSALDALDAIRKGVPEIEGAVCEWLGLTPLAGASPGQRITRVIGLLRRVETLPELAAYVHTEATRLNRWARSALGEAETVHRLTARCPICGAVSLRVFLEREIVACVNDVCICDDPDCGCDPQPPRRPRRHRWPRKQWEILAQILDHDDLTSQQEAS